MPTILPLLLPLLVAPALRAHLTENVLLVTLDGVRTQEVFGGMDESIVERPEDSGADDEDLAVARKRYWRSSPEERRKALMPFFWGTLAPSGIVLGNRAKGSRVTVRNDQWFSYPGYSEILTGQPQPDVRSNDIVRYPHRTVLEFVREKLALEKTKVAELGSWDGFAVAASSTEDAFFMNGARDPIPAGLSTPEMDRLVGLRARVMELWEESSNDVLTFEIARAYLEKQEPRVMWIGLSQSDDWAHARRYDRLLDYLHLADELLAELWETVQSLDAYRGRTTLVVTTDHGRGNTPRDWVDHDAGVEGSENIWIAVVGPDTPPRGEAGPGADATQSDVAATILRLLDLDYREFNPGAGPPIEAVFAGRKRATPLREASPAGEK